MTTPNVPLRHERTFEVPGTVDQVWQALATANGISSWFLPTQLEEREGGAVRFDMGEGGASEGSISRWDPPTRLVYEEPDWAEMTGHAGAAVTPMMTEFLVEAKSGGTCVVRVVTSAFGSGADWEQEFFDDMWRHWAPYFDNLRLYLTHFPGQQVTSMSVEAGFPGPRDAVWSALMAAVGATEVGQSVVVRGVPVQVERITRGGREVRVVGADVGDGDGDGVEQLFVRMNDPVPGFLLFSVYEPGNGLVQAAITGYLFSDRVPQYAEHEQPRWQAWLEELVIAVA